MSGLHPCLAVAVIPPGANPWTFLVLGFLAVMIFGVAKAGFGGLGAITTPLMVIACGGDSYRALAVMLPLLIACDYVALGIWWRRWNWPMTRSLLPGMVLGVALGGVALALFGQLGGPGGHSAASTKLTSACLNIAIGLISLVFAVIQWRAPAGAAGSEGQPVTRAQAGLLGSAAGFTSTLAHAAGPVVTMFLLPRRLEKGAFVATTALFFWIANQVKLVPYFALRLTELPPWGTELALLPGVLAGAALGRILHDKVNQQRFNRVVHVLLAVTGAYMCGTGLLALRS